MAWNPSPKIADLRELSRKWKAPQVITIEINPITRQFGVHSFGATPALCQKTKAVADVIFTMIGEGQIPIEP